MYVQHAHQYLLPARSGTAVQTRLKFFWLPVFPALQLYCIAQVEALGRSPQLEALGYFGKQAYWIRCGSCVNDEHGSATAPPGPSPRNDGGSADERQEGEEADAEGARGRGGDDDMSGTGGREQGAAQSRRESHPSDQSESESESDSEPEREPKPEPMPFAVALTLLQDHPAAKAAFLQPRCVHICCKQG